MLKVAVEIFSRGNIEFGKWILNLVDLRIAALRDSHRALQRIRNLAEEALHLVSRLYIELIALELEALLVVNRGSGLDAQQNFMCVGVLTTDVVAVIRGD